MTAGTAFLRASGLRHLPVIGQATATECGLACVAMIANYLGSPTDLVQLRRRFSASLRGATLQQVAAACHSLQLSTRAVRCGVDELRRLRKPCVLHWRFNHFVVLKAVRRGYVVLHDPARGCVKEPLAMAGDAFTGVALEVSRSRRFKRCAKPLRLRLSGLVSLRASDHAIFAAGLLLALVCEALLLASPFYLQVVIDQVLGRGDQSLLDTLAIGFGALLLFQVAANVMRQLTFQFLSQVTVFDISARVLHQLLQRSLNWFRSRDLGDVQHRVQSLRRVQEFIVHSAPVLIIDLLFSLLITGLMSIYDAALTALALIIAAAWGLWRAATFPLGRRLSNDIAVTDACVQTHFLETLRAVQSVKLLGGETSRESEWCNLFAGSINARFRAGNLGIVDIAVRQTLFQGLRITAIYLLAKRGLEGQMSIGMVSAYVAYLGMFMARSAAIVDRLFEYRLLEVPLNRLADIVFGGKAHHQLGGDVLPAGPPALQLESVHFRYAPDDPAVLCDCSCRIEKGSFTAITGASGCGKSTLLRLMAGVEPVSSGELRVGGVRLADLDIAALRQGTSTVFENDCLVRGSVADNIALFDLEPDRMRIRNAARAACIAADIEALPMAYETRIGDLGSSLSKGQMRRLLLARALYRRPQLLLLDEATSGLDSQSEKRVIRSLLKLDATRIAVTHSDQLLQAAHQVLWLHNGRLLTSRPELNA
ncbi:MAG: peptidase domain-containing ABC transporter [Gammaproteobacteria bacterium]|nr:peptidase domain-containing ABC transporter [Gammaproteobacteria bacterium]